MKNMVATVSCPVSWLILLHVSLLSSVRAEVTTRPAPPGEAITGDYIVTVDGKPVDVYAAQSQYFEGDYYFASFDFSGKAAIRVTSSQSLEKVLVQPSRFGVGIKSNNPNEITLTANTPFRISIERNGRIKPLLLFGNALETDAPRPGDPNVVYFPPGVHRPGKITLTDNQTLYLAAGAVVKGCIQAKGDNITIRGRGILGGEESPRFKGPGRYLLDCRDCRNITVRDITIRNPWSWTFVTWNCDGVMIDNVKICGSRMINDDALDLVNTQNVTVRNCFFRTQDDSIAIKGLAQMTRPCENIRIENCEFWTDVANIFRTGYECETPGMRNITARNIDVLHYSKNYKPPTHYWANAIIWLQPNQEMVMENCHFDDIRVRSSGEDVHMLMAKPMSCHYGVHKKPEPGSVRNCSFRNIQVVGEQGDFRGLLYMLGDSEKHNVSRLLFEHLTYFGQPVTQDSPCVQIGPHVADVRFIVKASGETPAKTLTVFNRGRCGQNSGIARKRFEADTLASDPKPDYVLIYIGMNDVINDRFFTPLDEYLANVKWMIEQSRQAGIIPVVCTIHHVVEDKVYKVHPRTLFAPETMNGKIDRYNTAIKKVTAEFTVKVADFSAITDHTPPSEFLSDDGVHLTASGNRLLAKTFFDVIGPQLRGEETIVCIGDSLTFGYRNQGAGTAEGETYPAMLRQLHDR